MPCMSSSTSCSLERRDSERDVVEHFGLDPSETERNERTERWIFGYADERLDAGATSAAPGAAASPSALSTSGNRAESLRNAPLHVLFVAQVEVGLRQHRSCAEPRATAT